MIFKVNQKLPLLRLLIIAGFLVSLTALLCSCDGQQLADVPIVVGDDFAFQESGNSSFDKNQVVTWYATDLILTTDGTIYGSIATEAPPEQYDEIIDVLFYTVVGHYYYDSGDSTSIILSEVLSTMSSQSTKETASFIIDGQFEVPSLKYRTQVLEEISLDMTWLRIYPDNGSCNGHVFTANTWRYTESHPIMEFNEKVDSINGRFDYYQIIRNISSGGELLPYYGKSGFNYRQWIRDNIAL